MLACLGKGILFGPNRAIADSGESPPDPPPDLRQSDDPGDSGLSGGSSGGGGSNCFIATAAYGSPIEPQVRVLRKFRDKILIDSSVGSVLVDLYYTCSPPMADFVARHDVLRAIVRFALVPVVAVSWIALNFGLVPMLLFMIPLEIMALQIPTA